MQQFKNKGLYVKVHGFFRFFYGIATGIKNRVNSLVLVSTTEFCLFSEYSNFTVTFNQRVFLTTDAQSSLS